MKKFSHATCMILSVLVLVLSAGCTVETLDAQGKNVSEPELTPKPPRCQQNDRAKEIAGRLILSSDEHHYAHLVQDKSDTSISLLTDGVMVEPRFSDVGPIVFHRDYTRFAFIGVSKGVTYVLEYASGAQHPRIAKQIQAAAKNKWVCYSESGNYLFTLAQQNNQWFLLVLDERNLQNTAFQEILLAAEPSALELLPPNSRGAEGFRYEIDLGGMTQEIRNWFK